MSIEKNRNSVMSLGRTGAGSSGCGGSMRGNNTYSSKRSSNVTSNALSCGGGCSAMTNCCVGEGTEPLPAHEQGGSGPSMASTTQILQPDVYSKYQRGAGNGTGAGAGASQWKEEESYQMKRDNHMNADCCVVPSSPVNVATHNSNNLLDVRFFCPFYLTSSAFSVFCFQFAIIS